MSLELTKLDFKFIEELKKELIEPCKKCDGGYIYSDKEDVKMCDCMKVVSYIAGLKRANIPMDYWELSLENLSIDPKYVDKTQYYIDRIDNAIKKGIGMFFSCSTRGVGKTSLACEIGKAAVAKRYDVYYNIMQVVVSDKFTDNQKIIDNIKKSELVIIDEIDKVAMKKESNLSFQIENFLREILPSGKAVILCSNMSLEEIEEKIKIESLIQRYMQIINMKGKDFSTEKNKNLNNLLDSKIDYFSPVMLKNAEIYRSNKDRYYEKEYYNNFSL